MPTTCRLRLQMRRLLSAIIRIVGFGRDCHRLWHNDNTMRWFALLAKLGTVAIVAIVDASMWPMGNGQNFALRAGRS